MAERVFQLLHRDFGPKNFDNSPYGGYQPRPHYIDESGRRPEPIDKTVLLEKFRRRLFSAPEQTIPARFTNRELGSRDYENPLPISEYKDVITKTIQQNQVSIIVAETGAGKSTQVPQYLLEAGYTVTLTQPRRLAANMLGDRIASEVAEAFGDDDMRHLVGVHTAERNTITDATRVSVVTDGLRLVQELNERGDVENEVLIIDEIHEWNKNIEVLVAWVKRSIKEKPNLRVVFMSATMNAQGLADFISDGNTQNRPPIIEVPGRTFGVEKIEEPDSTVFDQTVKYAQEGNNILVFLPGVREIDDMKRNLEAKFEFEGMDDITILPLHSKLSDQEQKAVDSEYPGPKIILATNIAQTSLTIRDIDVVVDSGLERRVEIDEEGVQSLRLHAISKADADQRAGRAGRTHAGIYILTRMDRDTAHVPYISREDYPTAEILRSDIDRNTLDVAGAGLRLSDLELFHPVSRESLLRSEHGLRLLGAVDDEGRITQRGRRMNQFRVHPTSARMLIESDEHSDEVRAYVSAVVSAIEVGKLPSYLYTNSNKGWETLTDEVQSDHLAQLDIFIGIQDMLTPHELASLGLDVRNVARARELHDKISRRAGTKPQTLQPPTAEQRREILECVTAGLVDYVYKARGESFTRALGHHATQRVISNRSVAKGVWSRLVVGTPYQYQHPVRGEQYIIENVSPTLPSILGKVARDLLVWANDGQVSWRNGMPVYEQQALFRDEIPVGEWREVEAEPSAEVRKEVLRYVMSHPRSAQISLRGIKKELEALRRLAGDVVPQFTQKDLEQLVERATPDDITDPSLVDEYLRRIMVEEGISLDNLVAPEERERIYENSPPTIEQDGIEFRIRYSHGTAKIHINHPAEVASLQDEVYLPDGRHVGLMYQKKAYTLERLKQM